MTSLNEQQQGEENVLHEFLPREEYQKAKHEEEGGKKQAQKQLGEVRRRVEAHDKESLVSEIASTPNSAAAQREPLSREFDERNEPHSSKQQQQHDGSPRSPVYVSGEGSSSLSRYRRQPRDDRQQYGDYYQHHQQEQQPRDSPRNYRTSESGHRSSNREDYHPNYSSPPFHRDYRRHSSSHDYPQQPPIRVHQEQYHGDSYPPHLRRQSYESGSRSGGDYYHGSNSQRRSSQSPPPHYTSPRYSGSRSSSYHHHSSHRNTSLPFNNKVIPPKTRYWFMLAFNEGDIELSQQHNLWATKKRLCSFLNDQLAMGGSNILIFGVFGKLYVAGYAIMTTPVGAQEANKIYPWLDVHSSRDKNFGISWVSKTYVHYDVVNKAHRLGDLHDATEIEPQRALEIIKIIDENAGGNPSSVLVEPAPDAPQTTAQIVAPAPQAGSTTSYQQSMSTAPSIQQENAPSSAIPHHISPQHGHGNVSHSSYYSPPSSPSRKRHRSPQPSYGREPNRQPNPHYQQQQQQPHYDDYRYNSYKRRRHEYDEGGDKGLLPTPEFSPHHQQRMDPYGGRSGGGYDKYDRYDKYDKYEHSSKNSYDKSYGEPSPHMEREHRYMNRLPRDEKPNDDYYRANYYRGRQPRRDEHYTSRRLDDHGSSSYHSAAAPPYYHQSPQSSGPFPGGNNGSGSNSSSNISNQPPYATPRNGSYSGNNNSSKQSPYHSRR